MMRCRLATSLAVVCALAGFSVPAARASDESVVQELLDILKRNDQISQEKYDELRQRVGKEEEGKLRVFWKDGFHLESTGGAFKLKLGARLDNDWAVVAADGLDDDFGLAPTPGGIPENRTESLDDVESGTEFRRARISLEGQLYEVVPFKLEYDFAGGEVAFKDVWIGLTGLPGIAAVKVGHMKEPFSLEELTSSKFTTFLERALPNGFVPDRNTGIGVYVEALEQRLTWATGAYRDTDDFGDGFGSDSKYNITSRLTGVLWYEDGGRHLAHLGFSYSHQFRNNDSLRYRRKPESDLSPVNFVDTRLAFPSPSGTTTVDLKTDGVNLLNPEFALVFGPFSLQSESVHSLVDEVGGRDPNLYGVYVFASYFLTGEYRPYKLAEAAFDRVRPQRNFLGADGGWGAWEIAARFSRVDLDDGAARGGVLNDVTAAVNWYLNPNVKIMLNYVYADREDLAAANIVQGRFHIDF
jgi:phosphate-selective porin OprO and OprP